MVQVSVPLEIPNFYSHHHCLLSPEQDMEEQVNELTTKRLREKENFQEEISKRREYIDKFLPSKQEDRAT